MILNEGSLQFNILGRGNIRIYVGDQCIQLWYSVIYCHFRLLQLAQHSKMDLNESTRESAIVVFKSDVEVYEKKVAQFVNWKSRVYVRIYCSICRLSLTDTGTFQLHIRSKLHDSYSLSNVIFSTVIMIY